MKTYAQTNNNLVLNGDFEQGTCPNSISQIDRATGWSVDCGNPNNTPDLFQYAGGNCPQFFPQNPFGNNIIPNNNPSHHRYMVLISSNTGNFNESGMGTLTAPLRAGKYYIKLNAAVPRTNLNQTPVGFSVRLVKKNDCTVLPYTVLSGNNVSGNNWQVFETCFDIAPDLSEYYDAIIIQREKTFTATQTECGIDDVALVKLDNYAAMKIELSGSRVLDRSRHTNMFNRYVTETYTVMNPLPFTTYSFSFTGAGTIATNPFPIPPPNSVKIKWDLAASLQTQNVIVNATINTPCGQILQSDTIRVAEKCNFKDPRTDEVTTISLDETSASALTSAVIDRMTSPDLRTLFVINGDFIVDKDVEFRDLGILNRENVGIILNPGARIILKGKNRLFTLTNVILSPCICCDSLYKEPLQFPQVTTNRNLLIRPGCNKSFLTWQGIYATDETQKILIDAGATSGAASALNSENGAKIEANGSSFENIVSINIKNSDLAISPITLTKNTFNQLQNFDCYQKVNDIRYFYAPIIKSFNVRKLEIASKNTFSYKTRAIQAWHTNLVVEGNTFYFSFTPTKPTGWTQEYTPYYTAIWLSGMDRQVVHTESMLKAQNNTFDGPVRKAILTIAATNDIRLNNFINCETAIHCYMYSHNTRLSNAQNLIYSNKITNFSAYYPTAYGLHYAIVMDRPYPESKSTAKIWGNKISTSATTNFGQSPDLRHSGIFARYLNQGSIRYNSIELSTNNNANCVQNAIKAEANGTYTVIADNALLANDPNAALPNNSNNLHGISLSRQYLADITKNNITGFGAGVFTKDNALGTQYTCNALTNNYNAFNFMNATISNQGAPTQATGNEFISNVEDRLDGNLRNISPPDWHYQAGGNTDINPYPAVLLNAQLTTTPNPSCGTGGGGGGTNPNAATVRSVFDFMQNEPEYQYKDLDEQQKYADNRLLYHTLYHSKDTLLGLGLPNDSWYKQKYYELQNTNIGAITHFAEYIQQNNPTQALNLLKEFVPQNTIEQNWLVVSQIFADLYLSHATNTLSEKQTEALLHIAEQRPTEAGHDAVFAARAMLGIDLNDSYGEVNNAKNKQKQQILRVYPNPANDVFYIQLSQNEQIKATVFLYDNLGMVVDVQTLSLIDNKWTVDTKSLANGFYSFKLLTNEEVIGMGKIIIAK
jgi:hypothetical protein